MSDKLMSWFSYAGAMLSVFTGLTLTEWGIIVGIVTAILTYATNAYYTRKRYELEKHRHELENRFIYQPRQELQEEPAQVDGGQQ